MQNLVFSVVSERCGSNLLTSIMDAHSQIYAPMPLHLGLEIWDRVYRYGALTQPASWRLLVQHVVNTFHNMPIRLDFDIDEQELLDNVPAGNFKDLFEYIYIKGMEQAGKKCLFIKDNHIHRQFPYLLRYYPDAKFVFQIRDPRDYVLSCKRVSEKYTHYGSVGAAMEVWRDEQERALSAIFTLPATQVFAHTYEDLVDAPEQVLRALCDFIGVPFEQSMLEFHNREAARDAAKSMPSYWGNLDKPLLRRNKAKYREGLSAMEIRRIEAELGPLMQQFGYALDYEGRDAGLADRLKLNLYRLGTAPLERLQELVYRRGRDASWPPAVLNKEYEEARAALDQGVPYTYR